MTVFFINFIYISKYNNIAITIQCNMTENKDKVEITDKTLSHNVVSSTPRHERYSN